MTPTRLPGFTRRPLLVCHGCMSVTQWIIDRIAGGALTRAAESVTTPPGVLPPPRRAAGTTVTSAEATSVPAVYRAVQILATSAGQLSLDVERRGSIIAETTSLVRRPNVDMSRAEFIESVVISLALTGNAYLMRHTHAGETINLEPLNPHHVHVTVDDHKRVTYHYEGRAYDRTRIQHLKLLPGLPGTLTGLGPIQAAQSTLRSTLDMREHLSRWFVDTGQPSGILTSDQAITGDEAAAIRNRWNGLDDDGQPLDQTANPTGIKTLGKGFDYKPILLTPKDALWIDAQAFSVTEVARLFGVPSSLMLVTLDGNSQTYSNVEQDWLAFVRFTLMAYLRRIEDALTEFTPRGQTVRFNIETLLRSDTKTRYEAHQLALNAGFMTIDEVRAIENLPALDPADLPTAKDTSNA